MIIKCACGCGNELDDKDSKGRTRKYITFHFNKTLKGKPRSEETKKKISQKNSQREFRPEEIERCRMLAKARIGKPLTEEHKRKIGLGCKGKTPWNKDKTNIYSTELLIQKRILFSGENNPKWKGGIYKNIYPPEFNKTLRKIIRKRDNYLCMLCNNPSPSIRGLPVHHIDYSPNNNIEFNCITLCYSCHKKIHLNKDKIDWITLFKRLLNERYGYHYETICQESVLSQ